MGSRNGLFIPQGKTPDGELWICEGPTDTAAALDLGHYAVGRPDCNGGGGFLQRFVRANHFSRAVIVADRDKPGQEGSHKLAREIHVTCRVWTPPAPAKDLRAWYVEQHNNSNYEQIHHQH